MPVSSASNTRSPSASTSRAEKNKKLSQVVVLKVPRAFLKTLEPPSTQDEEQQSTQSVASSPAPVVEDTSSPKPLDTNDNPSESNATPAPTNGDANSTDSSKKRKGPGSGLKRSLGSTFDVNGTPKPRGKPGPKKKPRLEDGTIDHGSNKPVPAMGAGITGHKLGPKANQGAINAGLRALDRSGKPCRKWQKRPFQLKSFTGIVWDVPSWHGNDRLSQVNGDESSDTREISQQSSSDLKPNESDTAMESNVGDQADPMIMSTPAASSPPPIPQSTTAITAQG
ncbi:hypothetical protein PV10_03424 [Exophiala mesophila]|uniref:INO80 complex subunit Ies4 n=1 Tax=Exophiala mesophila TaxID=212818 RepID=A0A0D2AA46_EXOME|nr:uncharacterized protein PV10_03424 [Exophiala mesophila]KIV95818.1 hypothetical protein PV10_03424 [Exophiala mesophila]